MVPRVRGIAAGLLLIQTLLIVRIQWATSPVLDELPHLAAGLAHWEFGSFELYRVNPPLVRMVAALPVMAAGVEADWRGGWSDDPYDRPEFPLGRRLAEVNGERIFWLVTLARLACLPFVWLGGWVCFRWARELYGDFAGLTALGLWCVCPNVLAWGATVCPDLPAASLGVWASYTYWCWLRSPTAGRVALAGVATGLALLTKSTWVMLPVLWVGLWLMWCGLSRGDNWGEAASQGAGSGADDVSPARPGPSPRWIGLIAIVGIALYVVHAGYGFRGSFRPWGEFGFISRTLNGNERFGTPGNRWAGTMWAKVPVPLPAEYLRGMDVQRSEFEQGKWSYLRGEQKHGGWWWYYLYAFGVKTPLGTLALLAVALLSAGQRRGRARRRDELVLLAPALAVLVLVSSQTGFNRYLRYALPAVPFVFIGMSRVASEGRSVTIGAGRGCRLQWRRLVVGGCLVLSSIGSLAAWPYSLSFFNRLAGGPARGHRHLLDANLDWGQGLLALRDWLEDHPEARPLFLTDFGWVDPRLAGISARPVPRLLLDTDGTIKAGVPEQILPGWYAISINRVMGYRHDESDRPVFTWLQEFEPIATPGGSLWVYHLTETDVRAFAERHPRATAKK